MVGALGEVKAAGGQAAIIVTTEPGMIDEFI
jgi:hypothetical protein